MAMYSRDVSHALDDQASAPGHERHAHTLGRRAGGRLAPVFLRRRTCGCWIWHSELPALRELPLPEVYGLRRRQAERHGSADRAGRATVMPRKTALPARSTPAPG